MKAKPGKKPLPPAKGKQPLRLCAGCRQEAPRNLLVKVVRTPDKQVVVDPQGHQEGRGAYLCRRQSCYTLARKYRKLDKALRLPVPPEAWERLEALCVDLGPDADTP